MDEQETLTRSRHVNCRFRPHEVAKLRRAAERERVRLSEFCRRVLLDAAGRRLRGAADDSGAEA